ncbi:MAG: hypothetical protein HYS52_00690 [Candidatus Wildermuthbacteria bacterium]|nr:hypothetical protein [Candidatus Wildermuthbacteria bacterium]
MNDTFKQFIQRLGTLKIRTEDRMRIRDAIFKYAKTYPVRKEGEDRRYFQERSMVQRIRELLLTPINPMPILAGFAILVLTGGGITLAAEQALPGDPLFPVKITVNEGFRTILALSDEAKADIELIKTERRLQELEKLAVQGKLKSKIAADVNTRVEKQTTAAADSGLKLKAKGNLEGAAKVFSDLEAALKTHEKILMETDEKKSKGDVEAKDILVTLRAQGENTIKIREEIQAEVSQKGPETKKAAEGKMKAAENKLTEVESFIVKMRARAGARAVAEAETRLESAKTLFAEGKAKIEIEAEAFAEAFAKFQEAMRIAQEAKLLVETSAETDVDIDIELKESQIETEAKTEVEAEEKGMLELESNKGETNIEETIREKVNVEGEVEIKTGL